MPLARHVDGTDTCAGALRRLADRGEADLAAVEPIVREILDAVRAEGDDAVARYQQRFGGHAASPVFLAAYDGAAALAALPACARSALELAASRIRAYHEHQRDVGFRYESEGVCLGSRVAPIARAGVYAPGGKARYPSSVLMSAIPAAVAGVRDVVLATPLAHDATDAPILAAAWLSGVRGVVDAGGAQAIAALAWGTGTVPRVDKIVGPGNVYVACAKRLVSGVVSIDSIAGPSEILVIADDGADPEIVAADLLSQAEHDEAAYPLLACTSAAFADAVDHALEVQLADLPRAAIARASLSANGHAFVARDRARLAAIAEALAVEHVSFQVEDPESMLSEVRCVGAAFLGPLTPEAAGDYLAGPSHVLPTGGAVRFGSPLGVHDFLRRTSLVTYSAEALRAHADAITTLARLEGLEGHARAVELRLDRNGSRPPAHGPKSERVKRP